MVGRDVETIGRPATTERADARDELVLDHVDAMGLIDLSLRIASGEILGIAGVDGNGQQEFAEVIVGLRPCLDGRISLNGRDISRLSFKERVRAGVAHVPNDRKRKALVAEMSITENMVLKRHDCAPFSHAGVMSWSAAACVAGDLTQRFDIRAASVDARVGTLSGGNQQKVVLARELGMSTPGVIVAMNPVRGLDIAATNFVYQRFLIAAAPPAPPYC